MTAADFSALSLEEEAVRSRAELILNQLEYITELDLSGASIDDRFLIALSGLSRLETLSLRDTKVSSRGLAALLNLEALRALDLSGTEVDDDGMALVARLEWLETLRVARTHVTERGMEHLEKLVWLSSLDLEGTDVSDEGLGRLTSCTRLERVRVGGARVTDVGVTQLASAIPGVRVVRSERVVQRVVSSPGVMNLHPPMKPSAHCLDDVRDPRLLEEDTLVFADRIHELNGLTHEGLPPFLRGAELIRNANGQKTLAGFTVSFDTTRAADVYLLIDNRVGDRDPDDPPLLGGGVMDWVEAMGFERTEHEIGVDQVPEFIESGAGPGESIDQRMTVFALKGVAPRRHTFREQNAGLDLNMYALAVVPAE